MQQLASLPGEVPCRCPNVLVKPTQKAPGFTADAYWRGDRITVRLSDFGNDWALLFFYASDFTFADRPSSQPGMPGVRCNFALAGTI